MTDHKTIAYTRGPWTVDSKHPEDVLGADGRDVACTAIPEDSDDWYGPDLRSPNENAANARLIAAAPDLLMALAWLVGLKDNRPADYEEQRPLAWGAARAAIAKAEGKQP